MDRLTEDFIQRFFDCWEDYPPEEVRRQWEKDLAAAFEATMKASDERARWEAEVRERLEGHVAVMAGARHLARWKPGPPMIMRARRIIRAALDTIFEKGEQGG